MNANECQFLKIELILQYFAYSFTSEFTVRSINRKSTQVNSALGQVGYLK